MELVSELNQSRTGDYPEFVMVCQSFTYLKKKKKKINTQFINTYLNK